MPSVKELREQRNALVSRLREISDKAHNEKRDLTAEEQKNWEDINKEVSRLGGEITRGQTLDDLEKDLNDPGNDRRPGRHDRNGKREQERDRRDGSGKPTKRDRNVGTNAWFRHQSGVSVSKRHREAAQRAGINLRSKFLTTRLLDQSGLRRYAAEQRAQSAIALGAGGALVADTMAGSLERALLSFVGVRQAGATVYRTETGGEYIMPTSDDTSNEGELVGENSVSNDGDFAVGGIRLQAFKFSSKFIKVPAELIEDAEFDVPALVGDIGGERIARRQNRELTTGTGGNRPWGVVTKSFLGVTAASQSAISSDEVLQLLHSVDPAYRDNGKFMGHDGILLALRLLKDGDGNYIWKPGMSEGQPDMLFGKEFVVNQHMQSSIATGTKTLLFGDFSKYVIREVRTPRTRRLLERFADADQEGFITFHRYDGNLLDAGTHPIKHLIQA